MKMWERDPLNFAMGATAAGFLLGLLVPVTRLEAERLPAAVDAVRNTLDAGQSASGERNGGDSSTGSTKALESALS
jgi:hypothetical protein